MFACVGGFFSSRSEFFCVLGVNHNVFFPLHFLKLRIKGRKPFYTSGWKADQALGDKYNREDLLNQVTEATDPYAFKSLMKMH